MHCKELWPWEQDMFWNTSSPRQPNRNILPILTAQVNDLTPPQITVVRASAAEPGQIAVCGPQVLSCVWIWWLFGTFLKNDSILRVCLLLTNLTNGYKWSKAWCRTLYRLTLQELECVARLGSCRWMSQAGASQLYNPKLPVARPRVMQELFGASALLPLARRLSVQVGCAKGSKHAKQERSSVLQFFLCSFCFFRLVHLFVFRYGHMVLPQKQSCRKQTWIRTWRLEISTCTRFTENVLKIECKSCPNALVQCKNNISQVAVATYGTVELPLISVLAGLLSEEV